MRDARAKSCNALPDDLRLQLEHVSVRHGLERRIAGDHFIDLDGPALPGGCKADVSIETPPKDGARTHDALVITVDDPHPRAGCPPKGRQVYRLAGDVLRLTEYPGLPHAPERARLAASE